MNIVGVTRPAVDFLMEGILTVIPEVYRFIRTAYRNGKMQAKLKIHNRSGFYLGFISVFSYVSANISLVSQNVLS